MGGVAIVVFSDLVDSTTLLATLGDDRMERVRRAHVEDVTQVVTVAGGRVVKTLGDGVMASFESALGALRAAAGIQGTVERLDEANDGIGIAARVGVAAGEPIPDGEDLHGMAVVIASRLSAAAETGEVLVQDVVQALVASRDGVALDAPSEYELKGVPTPVRASRLLWRELEQGTREEDPATTPGGEDGEERDPRSVRLPPMLAAYAEEPLIGRDSEIDRLREATAPRPGRRAVLILGEPGIGKTRHAAAAAAEAHRQGATVVLARCPPEAVVPYEPWVGAIGELALAGDGAWCARLAEAAGAELTALVPELEAHAVTSKEVPSGELAAAEGGRYRLLRGIAATLSRAAAGGPLCVVLDDAHWCDPASAQALKHLLDGAPSRLALVVTARDSELGRRHPVSRVLSDLRRTSDLDELRLSGLDAPGMAALVGARVGRAITPQLAERLQARTAGNPFFAGELVRDLDEQGALQAGRSLEEAPVPDAVTDLVEERLARLDPATERLLGAVAAIGPTAPIALAAKAAGLDSGEAERAVREATSERLVNEVAAAEATVAFPHALIREALIAETDDPTLARLHLAIARALEGDPGAEPAELARHYGLSVELAGTEPAIVAYRAAAKAATEGHDHEQAAAHLRSALDLVSLSEPHKRAPLLLELGEQELLSADLFRARESFQGAIGAARATGDAVTLARAALGFAGGDIGFGWEVGTDDPAAVELLQEGLEGLGDSEPRLALGMIFRLIYLLIFSPDDEIFVALPRLAEELSGRLGDPEARTLARLTGLVAELARSPDDPLAAIDQDTSELLDLAAGCNREDLLFRVLQWSSATCYIKGRIPECEAAIEQMGEIAERLGSPRFTWEVDYNRAQRLFDRGDRAGGEVLLHRAGAGVRRLRPDIHMIVELLWRSLAEWTFAGETATLRVANEAAEAAQPRGLTSAAAVWATAIDGDPEVARGRMWALLGDDLESLRRPDAHVPIAPCLLAYTATIIGDRKAGERIRPLLEPLRSRLVSPIPAVSFGQPPEFHIGRLELLAGRPEAAVGELREAVARSDAIEIVLLSAAARIDLAVALHGSGDRDGATAVLAEAESMIERYGIRGQRTFAAAARAAMEGREPSVPDTSPRRQQRPIRALAARGGRRALATRVRGQDDESLEQSFKDPRRQRALLRAMARGFQPGHSGGFSGTIAYELEPLAIEPPPDAPWRWAVEVDSRAGRARLIEPAPLDTAVTVRIGLAEWVRVIAGAQSAVTAMVAGRCSVEGDVILAARLEAMFGGQ